MARERGKEKEAGRPARRRDEPASAGRLPALPELARRVIGLGLSGFFLTEETIRRALGDTLPKDWADFAADQSERTRKEFLERLSYELAQTLEKVDLAAVLRELLEGRTLEVRAEIRLGGPGASRMSAAVRDEEDDA
jgi:hypothetical protein